MNAHGTLAEQEQSEEIGADRLPGLKILATGSSTLDGYIEKSVLFAKILRVRV
jgi:hypothetical protein